MRLEDLPFDFWFDRRVPGASETEIRKAEAALGRQLPSEFFKALTLRNGGVSNFSSYQRGSFSVPVPSFFSVEELVVADRRLTEFGTPDGIIAIAGGAHEWLGLDYRAGTVPSVVFQESEIGQLEVVSPSFEAFLEGLTED